MSKQRRTRMLESSGTAPVPGIPVLEKKIILHLHSEQEEYKAFYFFIRLERHFHVTRNIILCKDTIITIILNKQQQTCFFVTVRTGRVTL
jgi:hypothetical protein